MLVIEKSFILRNQGAVDREDITGTKNINFA
jgi:hypothetical protein